MNIARYRGDILHEFRRDIHEYRRNIRGYRRDIHEYRRNNHEYRPISHEYHIDAFSISMFRSGQIVLRHFYDTYDITILAILR